MSSHRAIRMKEKGQSEVSTNSNSDSSCQFMKAEPMPLSELSLLLRDAHDVITTPTTALVQKARSNNRNKWSECHSSAQSFFENKNGFPNNTTDSNQSHLTLSTLQAATKDPMFRRIFKSMAQSQFIQQRGFKTKRSEKPGFGFGKDTDNSLMGNFQDMIGKTTSNAQSQALGKLGINTASAPSGTTDPKVDQNLDHIAKAFAEGYKAREENSSKEKGKRNLRIFLYVCLSLYLISQLVNVSVRTGTGGPLSFLDRQSSYEVNPEEINVNFQDVKGAEEAKDELRDVVNFLKDPEKYTSLGAKLPRGVLLVGPPGTGKTLLARAVAGEAGVPFFHASGSEFDEMFVGLGAKRIRQLFTSAKEAAPCIVFIDEFDSVGAKRTNSVVHPYANQTVNQLLNEMDGFAQNEGIIVMGATNKVNNLDKALRRPGRFDVEVTVGLPDFKGRVEILELYVSKIKKDASVDVHKLARGTTGFSGAELENVINQGALRAVQDGRDAVTMEHLEWAKDKRIMGPEKKNRIPDEETNMMTSFHEAGHTLVAYYTKGATPLHKVTIMPRGQSLGHTSFLPDKEEHGINMTQLRAQMDVSMGGRAAEELIYGPDKVTTGASSDLEQATNVANMLVYNGWSEKVGLRVMKDSELSPSQREIIDNEIKHMLQESYDRAKNILKTHQTELTSLANALMKYETLNKDEIKSAIEGKKLKK